MKLYEEKVESVVKIFGLLLLLKILSRELVDKD